MNHGSQSVHNVTNQLEQYGRLNSRSDAGVSPAYQTQVDSLSAHTDQTRFLEGEAGNRAQTDSRYGLTLALTGGF